MSKTGPGGELASCSAGHYGQEFQFLTAPSQGASRGGRELKSQEPQPTPSVRPCPTSSTNMTRTLRSPFVCLALGTYAGSKAARLQRTTEGGGRTAI
eukprot:scaffold1774_cov121-Isochrysis_galbana.AAC.11